MPIYNANLLQQDIDFELLGKLNDKYLLDSLANLGQREGIKGSSVTYNSLFFKDVFGISDEYDYFAFKYLKSLNKDDENNVYQKNIVSRASLYLKSKDQEVKYNLDKLTNIENIYNTFYLNELSFTQNFGFKLFNDIQKYYENVSYISIDDNDNISIRLFGKSVKNKDDHKIYEHIIYNTKLNKIEVYDRVMFLYNDNIENIYIALHYQDINNKNDQSGNEIGYLDYTLFKHKSNNDFLLEDDINADDLDFIIAQILNGDLINDAKYNVINDSKINITLLDTTIGITSTDEKILVEFDNEKNRYYSISTVSSAKRCNGLLTYIGLNIGEILDYLNNDLRYLIPNIIAHISEKLFTSNIETFTFRVLCKLYEAIIENLGITQDTLRKDNGVLYIHKDEFFKYLCDNNNLFTPYISDTISVEYINRNLDVEHDTPKIYYRYSTELDNIIKENKIVDFIFSGYYNNGYLLNLNFTYSVHPYIGEDLLWHINNKATNIQTNVNDKYFLDLVFVDTSVESNLLVNKDNTNNEYTKEEIEENGYITISNPNISVYKIQIKSLYDENLNLTINYPIIYFDILDDKHNYAFVGKLKVQGKVLYIIFNIIYSDTIYKAVPVFINTEGDISGKSLLLLEDLFNYDDALTNKTIDEIELQGFDNKLNINNDLYISIDDDKNVLVTNITSSNSSFDYKYIPSNTVNQSVKYYNSSDSTWISFDTSSENSSSIINDGSVNVSSELYYEISTKPLLTIREYLINNFKLLNKLGIFSFDIDGNKYIDYIGINRQNGYQNELLVEPIKDINFYLGEESTQYNDDTYSTHDTIRFRYQNIINDSDYIFNTGIVYNQLKSIIASNNNYYSYEFKLYGYVLNIKTAKAFRKVDSSIAIQPSHDEFERLLTDALQQKDNNQYAQFIINHTIDAFNSDQISSKQLLLNLTNLIKYCQLPTDLVPNNIKYRIYNNGSKIFDSSYYVSPQIVENRKHRENLIEYNGNIYYFFDLTDEQYVPENFDILLNKLNITNLDMNDENDPLSIIISNINISIVKTDQLLSNGSHQYIYNIFMNTNIL